MKISLSILQNRIFNSHPRTRKAQINTALGFFIKGMGMAISLVLVPVTIDYLSKDIYGTWLTISSIVTMLTFLDIGIGNGLRNKFSEALANDNINLARSYVSTAYFIFGLIQIGFIASFLLVFRYIPWQRIFNTTINQHQLQLVVLITAISMAMKLVLDILSYILFALQEPSKTSLINLLSNLLVLVSTLCLTAFTHNNLIYLAIITAICPLIVLLISSIVLYNSHLERYKPDYKLVNFKLAKSLLFLGYKFFFIQISVIVLFYTDNLIITQLFGPAEVTTYNISFRYFNTINTLFSIVVTPYWSAFTEAVTSGDKKWMKQSHRYLQRIWLGLVLVLIFMILVSDPIYKIWIGERIKIPIKLSIIMALFTAISCWNNITAVIINGLSKVKLQLYFSLFSALINIPLAIFLGKTLNIGSAGIILATSLSLLICSVFGGIQANKLVTGTATGIWNK